MDKVLENIFLKKDILKIILNINSILQKWVSNGYDRNKITEEDIRSIYGNFITKYYKSKYSTRGNIKWLYTNVVFKFNKDFIIIEHILPGIVYTDRNYVSNYNEYINVISSITKEDLLNINSLNITENITLNLNFKEIEQIKF